jgi:anti-sigma factor RsiW
MAQSSRNPKPTIDELIAFAAGELPAQQMQIVAAHVQNDAEAAATVAAYRAVRQTMQGDDSVAPPADLMARAKAIFRNRANEAANRPGVLAKWMQAVDRLVATIVYDSRVQPAAVRFADPSAHDRITLAFETDKGEVDLQAERLPVEHDAAAAETPFWRVMGQVTDESESAGVPREVALLARDSSAVIGQVTTDNHGQFAIDAPAGAYELLLRDGERAIVLTPIDLT